MRHVWVVEYRMDGIWKAGPVFSTRVDAREAARSWRYTCQPYKPRIRKYIPEAK